MAIPRRRTNKLGVWCGKDIRRVLIVACFLCQSAPYAGCERYSPRPTPLFQHGGLIDFELTKPDHRNCADGIENKEKTDGQWHR